MFVVQSGTRTHRDHHTTSLCVLGDLCGSVVNTRGCSSTVERLAEDQKVKVQFLPATVEWSVVSCQWSEALRPDR